MLVLVVIDLEGSSLMVPDQQPLQNIEAGLGFLNIGFCAVENWLESFSHGRGRESKLQSFTGFVEACSFSLPTDADERLSEVDVK